MNDEIRFLWGSAICRWNEDSYRALVVLSFKTRIFSYKITCKECGKSQRGEAYTMQTIKNHVKEKICQHT